ncbi:MAG: hypothetical protein OXE53_18425 [Deltaproteobacteria bacterium]|nr:hypothetical protein [Deltaproteobacteria bacterium]
MAAELRTPPRISPRHNNVAEAQSWIDRHLNPESRNGVESKYRCVLPGHDDVHASASANAQLRAWNCYGCANGGTLTDLAKVLGVPPPHYHNGSYAMRGIPSVVWTLRDHTGRVVARHSRYDKPDGGKDVTWSLPDGTPGLRGIKLKDLPLYRIEYEKDSRTPVIICEGEKAADALAAAIGNNLLVLGTVTGATSTPAPEVLAPVVKNAKRHGSLVYLWPDNDGEGRRHMQRIAKLLNASGVDIRIIEWQAAPEKGDAADWADSGQTPPVASLLQAAVPFQDSTAVEIGQGWVAVVNPHVTPLHECFERAISVLDGIELRSNVRSRRHEMYGFEDVAETGAGGWLEVTEKTVPLIFSKVEKHVGISTDRKQQSIKPWHIAKVKRSDLITVYTSTRRVDPFREWLESLPAADGIRRLDSMLVDLFGEPINRGQDHRLPGIAMRLLFGTAVYRAYHPGGDQPVTPVLISEGQGQGKSSLARCILPLEYQRVWFGDAFSLDLSRKEVAEVTVGKVIVEMPEMSGLRRAELAKLKSIQTTTDDGQTRAAYAWAPESLPRRWSGIATCDKPEALPHDPAGHRRWLAASIGPTVVMDMNEELAPIREQLWVEALGEYRDRAPTVPRGLWSVVAAQNRQYESRDQVDDVLVGDLPSGEFRGGVSITNLMEVANIESRDWPRRQYNFTASLRGAGWSRRRVRANGKQARLWFPPE